LCALGPTSSTPLLAQSFFFSFFKTLIGKEIAVELKNDVALTGERPR
jgi:hypothetical protein